MFFFNSHGAVVILYKGFLLTQGYIASAEIIYQRHGYIIIKQVSPISHAYIVLHHRVEVMSFSQDVITGAYTMHKCLPQADMYELLGIDIPVALSDSDD